MLTLSPCFLSLPSLSRHSSYRNITPLSQPAILRSSSSNPSLTIKPPAAATRTESAAPGTEHQFCTEHQFSSSFPMAMASPSFSTKTTLYETLGITSAATYHEIKAAYRRLARACHPDVVSVGQKDSSAHQFMKIHSAYLTLSDPSKRAGYDRELFVMRRRPGSYSKVAESGSGSFTACRNWETDQCW